MSEKKQPFFVRPKRVEEEEICSLSKLNNDRHQGKGFPYYKIDGLIYYDLNEIYEIIKKHRIEPEA